MRDSKNCVYMNFTCNKRNHLTILIILLIIVSLQIPFIISGQVNKPPELPLNPRREKGHPKIEFNLYKLLTTDRLQKKNDGKYRRRVL